MEDRTKGRHHDGTLGGLTIIAVVLLAGACGPTDRPDDAAAPAGVAGSIAAVERGDAVAESVEARTAIAEIRRFAVEPPTDAASEAPSAEPSEGAPRGPGVEPSATLVVQPSPVERFERDGAWIRPELPHRAAGQQRGAEVLLPARADSGFSLRDSRSSISLRVALVGARSVEAAFADGYVIYPAAAPEGGHVVHRPTLAGTEDYVLFDRAPAAAEIHYDVKLSDSVAGLRLVANVVEFLDQGGTPRLRMGSPAIVDRLGAVHQAAVAVRGCAHDTDPRAPWGRPTVSPGATSCRIHVSWQGADLAYPALLDPPWTGTGDMQFGTRYGHTASLLANDRVLIAGGSSPAGLSLSSVELYDRGSDTWAATGPLAGARYGHTASVLGDGTVLVAGGTCNGCGGHLATCERYDPGPGTWSTAAALTWVRSGHSANVLGDGRVLAAGGAASPNTATTELYDPVANTWTLTSGSLNEARTFHTANVLGDGRVLVAGGHHLVRLSTAELYDPGLDTWSFAASLAEARSSHASVVLVDGRVMVVAGSGGTDLDSTELYDPVGDSWTTAASALAQPRRSHTATRLGSGKVLVAGGKAGSARLISSEVFDPAMDAWEAPELMASARSGHAATRLSTGEVLVAGGVESSSVTPNAELFLQLISGACLADGECVSGFCVDGFCCDGPCDGLCEACSAALKGAGDDGDCGPMQPGTDPQDECLDSGSPTCANDGWCDQQNACQQYAVSPGCTPESCTDDAQCASGFCADGICCDAACDGGCQGCTAALKGFGDDGICESYGAGTDPENECLDSGALVCADNGLCDGQGSCQQYSVSPGCTPEPCSDDSQCADGHCVDDICCDGPCNGLCMACTAALKGAGDDGSCWSITAGLDPDDECTDDGSPACTDNGLCDGQGSCQQYADSPGCTPEPCADDLHCTSGHCVDGVCCDTACTGVCQACAAALKDTGLDGVCDDAAAGIDPHDDCAPDPDYPESCGADGTCDATGQCRAIAPLGTSCAAITCTEDAVTLSACDDSGLCVPSSTSCAPFGCTGGACVTTCTDHVDCAAEYWCIDGICQARWAAGEPCDEDVQCQTDHCVDEVCCAEPDCAPYRCEATGSCGWECATTADCATGHRCDSASRCVPSTAEGAPEDAGGCSCRVAGQPRHPPWLATFGLLGLVAARTIRRRRRP